MWFGVPVFAYAAGAVSETMGNAGRLFFSKDDPAGLARQAYALVHDPSLRQEVIERQRERQQAFLPAQVEQQLSGLVERLLGRRSGQVPAIVTAEPIENIREIAVVKLDHVGDLLLASPAFFSLRNRFPRARITAVTTPRSAPVLHHNPHVDCVVPYDPPWLWPETTSTPDGARMAANAQHLNQLLSVPFDLVVNLPSLAHRPSRLLASLLPHRYLLSQFHSDEAGGRSLITHGTEWRPNRHVSRHHLELLRAIGADAWCEPTVYFSDAERARATELGRPTRNTVALALGADTALQRWAQVKFRELARRLRARGYPVTIVGPESDRRLSDDWSAGLGCLDLCGRFELNELAAYLAGIGCLVANNSAPMHLGAAVGIPVVYITNPPAQQEFAPVGRHCVACTQAVCPEPCKGFDPDQPGSTPAFCRCVQSVSVDQVEQNVVQLLTAYEADRPGTPSESLSLGGAPASSS
jgi:ADP-heptose:LPS heptosyltransferase